MTLGYENQEVGTLSGVWMPKMKVEEAKEVNGSRIEEGEAEERAEVQNKVEEEMQREAEQEEQDIEEAKEVNGNRIEECEAEERVEVQSKVEEEMQREAEPETQFSGKVVVKTKTQKSQTQFKEDRKERFRKTDKRLGMLGLVEPTGVKMMDEQGEWEDLEMAVDSGAGETVVSNDMVTSVETLKGKRTRKA